MHRKEKYYCQNQPVDPQPELPIDHMTEHSVSQAGKIEHINYGEQTQGQYAEKRVVAQSQLCVGIDQNDLIRPGEVGGQLAPEPLVVIIAAARGCKGELKDEDWQAR